MPNYIRPKSSGAVIFFTVCLADRSNDLLVRHVGLLREAVRVTRAERLFEILAWVVLPEHLHCIWRLPHGDGEFSVRWGAIKGRFSMSLRRAGFSPPVPAFGIRGEENPALRKGQVGIWQERFWEHHVRSREELNILTEYCWFNPVKHGLVRRSADWPHSSFHRDMRLGLVPVGWQGREVEVEAGERVAVG